MSLELGFVLRVLPGDLVWSSFPASYTAEEFADHMVAYERLMMDSDAPIAVMIEMQRLRLMTSQQRSLSASGMKRMWPQILKRVKVCTVVVGGSALVRGFVTAIIWLVPSFGFPVKSVATRADAVRFLKQVVSLPFDDLDSALRDNTPIHHTRNDQLDSTA